MKRLFLRILLLIGISFLLFIAYFAYLIINATSVSDGISIQHYQNQKTALLVIDIQEGITGDLAADQTYVVQAPEFIKTVNELISIADSLKIPVIYIQQQTENWLLNWADGYVLAKGAPGVALDSHLTIISANHFTKPISDAFSNPELDSFLRINNINKLIITGLDIAYCANKTSLAAQNRGYEVVVIGDAVISESQELKEEKLVELKSKGIQINKSEFVIELFQTAY